jgi:hypothetical protein
MIRWNPVKLGDGSTHYEAELGPNWRLTVGKAVPKSSNRPRSRVRWSIQGRNAATGGFIDIEGGDCSSVEDGQAAAEAAYHRLQPRRGRPPKGDRPTTSTERSKQRMDRLIATAVAAGKQELQLGELGQDLAAVDLRDWAERLTEIKRVSALTAAAEYVRRNSAFFVAAGSGTPTPEEITRHRQRIEAPADKIDMLASRVGREPVEYREFEQLLDELRDAGFYLDTPLVSSVARAFTIPLEPQPITRAERLRRVVIVCCSFARNLAFYRAGWSERWQQLLSEQHPQASFWRQANANFLDICVLEWCKLFGDRKAEHYWGRIVSDPVLFQTNLLKHLGMDAAAFQTQIDAMRSYRDKFVAHLDSLRVMNIPMLDTAQTAVWFYHQHVVTREARTRDLTGLPDTVHKLSKGYEQALDEANAAFLSAGHGGRDRSG